jgi:sRNA-binding carbon storage regulator CsrA
MKALPASTGRTQSGKDGNITVVVNKVAGNRVTIGIEAPDYVQIVRGELEPANGAFSHLPSSKKPRAEVSSRNVDPRTDTAPLRLAK